MSHPLGKVIPGDVLFEHPTFLTLIERLGLPRTMAVKSFRLESPNPDADPKFIVNDQVILGSQVQFSDSYGLYHSPEFVEFLEAIGFSYYSMTVGFIIDAPGEGRWVDIIHTYRAAVKE